MNFLIKIHIGLFVYGLFIKAARIFGVYSVETDIFGNYFHFFPCSLCGLWPGWFFGVDFSAQQSLCWACRARPLRLADYADWQIFPLLISNNTTLRFEITPERAKEIIAFASLFIFLFGLWNGYRPVGWATPPASTGEKIHHKYIFHEYLSKTVLHFSLARCRWKEEGCVLREKGRKTLVRGGWCRDGDFIVADTSDISASACRTLSW